MPAQAGICWLFYTTNMLSILELQFEANKFFLNANLFN
jgi:hypothetical protein